MPERDEGRSRLSLRFHGALNDFLDADRRDRWFDHAVDVDPAVKDVIESLGVPHPEVDLILVDGVAAGFEYRAVDGDRIEVFPVGEGPEVPNDLRLAPPISPTPRFVLDGHLGRLARWLRLLGFDSLWDQDPDDHALAAASSGELRVLLTRDRGLLKRSEVAIGYCVRSDHPMDQLVEVVRRFGLVEALAPFTRCMACNGELQTVDKGAVADELEPGTRREHDEFRRCSSCGKVYWRGSHFERLRHVVDEVRERVG